MPRVPTAFAAFIGCLGPIAHADEFSWELAALVSEADQVSFQETEHWAVQATHFFAPIDDANGPYALASFFDPATRVSIAWSSEKQTVGIGIFAGIGGGGGPLVFEPFVVEAGAYSVGGRYVLPESKWYFGGSYTKSDIGVSASFTQPENRYGLLVGKYLGSATTLEVAWNANESERDFPVASSCSPSQCVSIDGTNKRQQDHAAVNVLHVRRSRSMTYSLSGRLTGSRANASVTSPGGTLLSPPISITIPPLDLSASLPRLQSYSVGAELFPTAKLGVRIGYTRWDDDTPADDAYDVAATWFVRRDLGLEVSYSKQSADGDPFTVFMDDYFDHSETVAIRVIGRL
jgi:hypothetical protein